MNSGRFVAYYRVSTKQQEASGLGLDSQRDTVMRFLNGGDWELLDEFTEVESGKRDDREQLHIAIKFCRLKNATLIVSKLDRLSRDVHFITSLQKSSINFVVAEQPEMNQLTIHLLAAIAQNERELISKRTKEALAQARKRGVKLGNPDIWKYGGDTTNARKARQVKADAFAIEMSEIITSIREAGISGLNSTARELNKFGFKTVRGREWTATAVNNLLKRLK